MRDVTETLVFVRDGVASDGGHSTGTARSGLWSRLGGVKCVGWRRVGVGCAFWPATLSPAAAVGAEGAAELMAGKAIVVGLAFAVGEAGPVPPWKWEQGSPQGPQR